MGGPALMGMAVLVACQSLAQTATTAPSFEVASVRVIPSSQGVPNGFSTNPRRSVGRISWVTNLAWLVRYSYHLPGWRILRTDKDQSFYAIEATTDASATEEQVRLMLQTLLVDRFKFAAHRETKEHQGFGLMVAKSSPKLKDASALKEAPPMPGIFSNKDPAAFEGRVLVSMEGKGTSALTGRGVSTSQLADTLSESLGAFVVDQTGMTGKYYFSFKFLALNGPGDDREGPPSIFTALQDEIGLKLEKQKGPVEFLVVEHVEKPSEN
jgi:uncharacterized protein (TIGR03435 family)